MRKVVLHRVDTVLDLLVDRKLLISMVPLAKVAKTFSGGSEIVEVIRFLVEADAKAGRPLRASAVVKAATRQPHAELFRAARGFGLLVEDETQFWHGQLRALGYELDDLYILGVDDAP